MLVTLIATSAMLVGLQGDGFKRERTNTDADSLKNGLEGKEPPAIIASEWLNIKGEPPTWKPFLGKVVILYFWAHWCGPCKASVPRLKELYTRYEGHGLILIGIHADKDAAAMKGVVAQLGITWPIGQDGESKTMKAFYADSFPDFYLVDRAGKVRFADLANSELERAVELLIKEKPPWQQN